MKQCPRCKSQLTKSHSEKLICRACGFITQKLEVARQNQQFQQTYNYSKRISLIKSSSNIQQQISQQQQLKNHYVVNFQNALKTAAYTVSKIKIQYRKIQYHLRFVWLAYLHKAAQLEIDISGIYGKNSNNQNNKKQNNINKKGEGEQNQGNEQKQQGIIQKQEQQQQNNNMNDVNINNSNNKVKQQLPQQNQWKTTKRPRGRPRKINHKKYDLLPQGQSTHQQKKPAFSSAIRHKLLLLHQNQQQLEPCLQRRQFLQFVYNATQSQCRQLEQQPITKQSLKSVKSRSKSSKTQQKNTEISKILQYISQKYAQLLIKQLNSYNLNLYNNVSQAKGKTKRVSNKELQQLITIRKLDFKERRQIMLVLLLQDMLKQWSNQMGFNQQRSLQDLLIIYSSSKNKNPKPIITATIKDLKLLISQQSSQSQHHSNISFPTLSMSLLYGLLYISCLLNGSTMSIDDIVLTCGKVSLLNKDGDGFSGAGKVCNDQIRKIAAVVMRVLGLDLAVTNAGLAKWVLKYAHACGILNQDKQLTKLTQTLYNSHQLTSSLSRRSRKRYDFLQQDIIAKSILIVHMKLTYGFRTYPYLSTFPAELINRIERMKTGNNVTQEQLEKIDKYVKFMRKLDSVRKYGNASLCKIVGKFQEQYGIASKRYRQLCMRYTVDSYSGLQGLTTKQLTAFIASSTAKHSSFSFNINLAYTYAPKQQYPMVYIQSSSVISHQNSNSIQQRTLSKTLQNQLKIAIKQFQNQNNMDIIKSNDEKLIQIYNDLDVPASNYQFFYDYINNIKHAGRELFIHFVQVLAARQCKVKYIYQWLQKMERVIIEFED